MLHKFMKLITGNVLSQVIMLLGLPVLARLYVPRDFGALALVMSFTSILGVVLALRYDMAIMLPKTEKTAINVVALAGLLALSIMTVLYGSLKIISWYSGLMSSAGRIEMIAAVSLMVILGNICTIWFNRREQYIKTSIYNVLRDAAVLAAQLAFCKMQDGLIVGLLVGHVTASTVFGWMLYHDAKRYRRYVSLRLIRYALLRYKKFPQFSLVTSLMNTVGAQLPVFLIKAFFGNFNLGIFSMMMKIVLSPMRLVSATLNNVAYQHFSKKMAHHEPIWAETLKMIRYMVFFSVSACMILLAAVKFDGLVLILGQKWGGVNDIITVMIPYMLVGFVSRAVLGFAMFERQELGFYYQLAFLLLTAGSFYTGFAMSGDFKTALMIYAVCIAALYLAQIASSLVLTRRYEISLEKT